MPDAAEPEPGELCLRCSHPNPYGSLRCGNCNAPLGSLSSGAPWEMTKVKDAAYRSQTDPQLKPIVFFGVWLYFGPTAIVALLLAIDSANVPDRSGSILVILFALFYLVFSVWALTAVTRRYLRQANAGTAEG